MDHLIEQCSDIAGVKPGHRKFQIVIVYENLVSAARALRACEFLRSEIGEAVSVEVHVWKISLLEDGDSRRAAANASSLADVVIVSASGREEIPPAFRNWMDAWLQLDQCGRAALFALFGEHLGNGALSVAGYLRRKTILNGIDFFCHPPIDGHELGFAADLERALGPGPMRRSDEWRPGQEKIDATAPSAFELVEDFAADLRARFVALACTDAGRSQESWKSNLTHQLFA
ncbi:MAG: hypothetical protein ACKOLA_14410 [Spartobacteria bacterium]